MVVLLTIARLFGGNFNISMLLTNFTVGYSNKEKEEIPIFIEPAHMVNLVKNTFGEKKYSNTTMNSLGLILLSIYVYCRKRKDTI